MPNPNPQQNDQVEGEGSRSADRHYREGATRHAESDKSKDAAQRAKRALDEEGESLKEAERVGKSKAKE